MLNKNEVKLDQGVFVCDVCTAHAHTQRVNTCARVFDLWRKIAFYRREIMAYTCYKRKSNIGLWPIRIIRERVLLVPTIYYVEFSLWTS